MKQIHLYRKNSLGIGTWRIWYSDAEPNMLYYAHSIVEDGAEVVNSEKIELNQSGRSLAQQMELEMNSRISRQLDKGYKTNRMLASLGATNQLGLTNPMLAMALDRTKVPDSLPIGSYVQRKYDGHRCLITRQDGLLIPYTRKGKAVTTIDHILADLDWLPEGKTLDGELYVHGRKIQAISSLIKRLQPGSNLLKYHWYDHVSDRPFDQRLTAMNLVANLHPMKNVELVESIPVETMADAHRLFAQFRAEGYEGAMLRLPTKGYQDSVRSHSIVKLKDWLDAEVTVLGATPSKDGWAILKVRTDWGVEFDTSAPGSVPEKTEVMRNIDRYIGRRLTIEYASLTEDRVPFHCSALRWREDL